MSQVKDARESSRANWNVKTTFEGINCGSLQRIADATELMAKRHQELQADAELFKTLYYRERERKNELLRRVGALKGVITRMKRKEAKDAVGS